MSWISVRNWRKFQHYDPAKRQPPWIKVYTELMSDEAWLALSGNDRSVLCCIWLEYASSRCRLRADSRSLTRQLNLRVTKATLTRLNHAGYIDIVASKTLAEGYHGASTSRAHVEEEKEKELSKGPTSPPRQPPKTTCPQCGLTLTNTKRLREHLTNAHWIDNEDELDQLTGGLSS